MDCGSENDNRLSALVLCYRDSLLGPSFSIQAFYSLLLPPHIPSKEDSKHSLGYDHLRLLVRSRFLVGCSTSMPSNLLLLESVVRGIQRQLREYKRVRVGERSH